MRRLVAALLGCVVACAPAPPPPGTPTPNPVPVHPPLKPSDRISYYDGLNRAREHHSGEEPDVPDPDAIQQAIAEVERPMDPAVTPRLRRWLFERDYDFMTAYREQTAHVLASPADSPWHRAEATWGQWMMAQLPTLTDEGAKHLSAAAEVEVPGLKTFPTIDRFAAGLGIADYWIRQGHPERDRDEVFSSSLCSVEYDYGKLHLYCDGHVGWWYAAAVAKDEDLHRLTAAVLARRDPPLTLHAALGLGTTPKTLTALADLEKDPEVWRQAVLAVGRMENWDWQRNWLVPELSRLWKAHPERRGIILYVLAEASGEFADEPNGNHGVVDFKHLGHDFEGGMTREAFVQFLAQSPRALELARWVVPARTKGWSIADVVVPQLDAYFALPAEEPKWPPRAPGFSSMTGYLCYTEHDLADVAKFREYFAKRAPAHPGDRLNDLATYYDAKRCRAH